MTWKRVLFVIDGIAVIERVEPHVNYNRHPVVRLSLPYLLDLLQPGEGLTNQPQRFEVPMENAWVQGMFARDEVFSDNDPEAD